MGLPDWLHTCTHLAWQILFLLLNAIIAAAILVGGGVFARTTYGFAVLFLLLFGMSVVVFSFAAAAVFSRASTAAAFGALVYFLSYVPYFFIMR